MSLTSSCPECSSILSERLSLNGSLQRGETIPRCGECRSNKRTTTCVGFGCEESVAWNRRPQDEREEIYVPLNVDPEMMDYCGPHYQKEYRKQRKCAHDLCNVLSDVPVTNPGEWTCATCSRPELKDCCSRTASWLYASTHPE